MRAERIAVEFLCEIWCGEGFFACLQPIEVALQGIDLPVVCDEPEWLGQFPGGEGIGGKAGVNQTESGNQPFVAQVGKIVADLAAGELAFVDHGLIGKGGHVETDGVLFDRIVDGIAGVVTQQKELPFESFGVLDMVGAGDENLFHFRLNGEGSRADAFRVDGYFSISQDLQAQLLSGAGEDIPAFFFQADVAGKEQHAYAIFTIGG